MGILGGIIKLISRRSNNRKTGQIFYPGSVGLQHGQLIIPDDYYALVKAYVSYTYICASTNANSVAQSTLRLYTVKPTNGQLNFEYKDVGIDILNHLDKMPYLKKFLRANGEVVELVEHPFLDLIENPNPFTSESAFMRDTDLYQELTGNSYWYIIFQNVLGSKIPKELWILPSPNMRVLPDKKEFIKGYEFKRIHDNVDIPLGTEEIVHFKMSSSTSPYYGTAPLQAVYRTHNISERIDTYEESLFANMGKIDGLITSENDIGEDEAARIKEWFADNFQSEARAGKVMVAGNNLEYKPMAVQPKDLSFLMGRKVTKEKIANAFGVPLSMLTMDAVGRANAVTGEYQYAKRTLAPRLINTAQMINNNVLPFYDKNLFVAFDNPVPEDEELNIKRNVSYVRSGIITANEARIEMGKPELEGGDELRVTSPGQSTGESMQQLAHDIGEELDKELERMYGE